MSLPITKEQFLKDVAEHQVTILRDDGLYRHVRFRKPGTICQWFDLITWPGYLCYCGDMGEYVFTRLPDMFEFFRRPDSRRGVDLRYWAEKCRAVDQVDGIKKYDADHAAARIREWIEDVRDGEPEGHDYHALMEAVEEEVLRYVGDGEHELRRTVEAFEHEGFRFHDFWEVDLTEYTIRFVWCCYALVWGIAQYDAAKQKACNPA